MHYFTTKLLIALLQNNFIIVFPDSLPFWEGLAVPVDSSKGGLIDLPAYRPDVTCMKVCITHALSNFKYN